MVKKYPISATLTELIQLSNKLGWSDMLSQIAIPALEEIIYISGTSVQDLLNQDSDTIFGYLAGIDVDFEDYKSLLSLRDEIEAEMRKGTSHTVAINEWWK